jgi:ElaB/YqjD/DUF883 family membrane-anchored ribosome-binding protein
MAQEPDLSDQDPQVIRQNIEETRSDLTRKLETLEQEVKETVKGAADAVVGTVETVRQTVQDTVGTVKETVSDTVQTVKHTFDLRCQTEEHPWPMLAGSVAVGFLAGSLLPHHDRMVRGMRRSGYMPGAFYPADGARGPAPGLHVQPETVRQSFAAEQAQVRHHGLLSGLGEQFAPEINKLKGLAIGAGAALLRDVIQDAVPPSMAGRIAEVIDSVTQKLGGEPIQGPLRNPSMQNR